MLGQRLVLAGKGAMDQFARQMYGEIWPTRPNPNSSVLTMVRGPPFNLRGGGGGGLGRIIFERNILRQNFHEINNNYCLKYMLQINI